MQKRRVAVFVTALLLADLGVSAQAAPWQITSTSCPEPAMPLSKVLTNVDRQIPKAVTEDGASAQLEIASAYAPQTAAAGAPWCMRYEVTNDGPDAVPLLLWPLTGLKMTNDLPPDRSPQSNVLTLPPGPSPTVKDTVLYAFKAETIKTQAFQAAAIPLRAALLRLVAVSDDRDQPPGATAFRTTVFTMDDRSSLPAVGGEFTGSGADVGATSTIARDGDSYQFTIYVGRNSRDAVASVFAPLARAFAKLPSEAVVSLPLWTSILNEGRSEPISLNDNVYSVSWKFTLVGTPPVYLVRQPITFQRSGKEGRVCFLAPTYSPIPIPESVLSCN